MSSKAKTFKPKTYPTALVCKRSITHLVLSRRGAAVFRTRAGFGPRAGMLGDNEVEGGGAWLDPQFRIEFIDLTHCDITLWNRPFEK